MEKKKILLIDDNEIVHIFFKDVFWLHGLGDKFDIESASGVDAGMRMINDPETKPDIIFLDLVMPYRTDDGKIVTSPEAGFSILKAVKENKDTKDIKVFVFSSYSADGSQKRAKELGADKFLIKEEHLPQDLVRVLEDYYRENP